MKESTLIVAKCFSYKLIRLANALKQKALIHVCLNDPRIRKHDIKFRAKTVLKVSKENRETRR